MSCVCNAALCGGEAEMCSHWRKGSRMRQSYWLMSCHRAPFTFLSVIHVRWNVETAAVFSDRISMNFTVHFECMKNIFSLESQTNRHLIAILNSCISLSAIIPGAFNNDSQYVALLMNYSLQWKQLYYLSLYISVYITLHKYKLYKQYISFKLLKMYDVAFYILIKIIDKLLGKCKTLQYVLLKKNYHLFWSGKINSASHHNAADYFSYNIMLHHVILLI